MAQSKPILSRRTLLQSAAITAGGIVAVGKEADVSRAVDEQITTFSIPIEAETERVQFNPRRDDNRSLDAEAFLYEPLAEYDPNAGEFVPVLAEDWSIDSDRLTVTLRSDYRWHQVTDASGETLGGQPVTAADLVRQLRLDDVFGADYWEVVASVSAVSSPATGGGTVRIEFDGNVNLTVMLFDILTRHLSHAPTYYEGRSKSAIESLIINPANAGPPIGTGPFRFASQDEDSIALRKASGHPAASDLDWEGYTLRAEPSENGTLSDLAAGSFDGTREAHFPEQFQAAAGQTPADSYREVTRESGGGWGILLNHHHPLVGNRKFRKAIAHVFGSQEAVASMSASLVQSVSLQTGLAPDQVEEYLADEVGKFEAYRDEKRAGELLGQLDFHRTWEQWNDSRGGPLTLGFLGAPDPTQDTTAALSASEPAWYYGARSFRQQLDEFFRDQDPDIVDGWFDGTLQPAPVGMEERFSGVGVHDDIFAFLPARQWGQMANRHPYHTFRSDMLLREASELGFGPVVEVPPYANPGGPMEEVDLREKLAALRRASDDEEEKRHVRHLAWIVNETVPYLQGYYRPSVSYLDETEWEFPDVDELGVAYPSTHLPRMGDIEATESQ